MNEESRRVRGADAQALLDNRLFKEAFAAVGEHLEAAALTCDPDDREKAQRIIIAKQLLSAVKREIQRVVEDGAVAQVQLAEIERRKGLLQRVFTR